MEENGSAEICVHLETMQSLLEKDAIVTLRTIDGTAQRKTECNLQIAIDCGFYV